MLGCRHRPDAGHGHGGGDQARLVRLLCRIVDLDDGGDDAPGAIPAVLRRTNASGRVLAAPVFAASYIAIWAVVGIAVYALYRPHGTVAAGVVVIAAGCYELTPVKRHFRLQCRENARSGLVFGLDCVGSSIGLMAMLVVVGVMSIHLDGGHRRRGGRPEAPARQGASSMFRSALAIVGLGVVILAAPSVIPGLDA